MAELHEWHDVVGHVGIGEQPDEATIAAMRRYEGRWERSPAQRRGC